MHLPKRHIPTASASRSIKRIKLLPASGKLGGGQFLRKESKKRKGVEQIMATQTAPARKGRDTVLMTEGSIFRNILLFSAPLILGNLLQQTYNAADSIIVGNFVGSNALAAVGSSTSLIYLLIAFSQGASVGASVIVSQYLGAKDDKKVRLSVHTAFTISAILGILLTIGGLLFSKRILVMMGTPAEVLPDSVRYLQIYSAGLIFNVVYNMAAGILNAAGNSRKSLGYLAAAAVTNIGVDLLLIGVFGWGVTGAAVATTMSQAVSCVLALGYLVRVNADYRVDPRALRIHAGMAKRIVQIGLPTGIQNMVISLSNVLVQASVNTFGAAAMAGFGAYLKIDGFCVLPMLSFGMAITTFVGQNYGAGNFARMKKGMWVTIAMGISYTIVMGIFLILFARQTLSLFSNDEAVIDYGVQALYVFCPFYWVPSIMHALAGTVRGVGKSIPPMIALLFSMCIFRIIYLKIILPHFDTIFGIYILYPISWAMGMVLMVLYVWKGNWCTYQK